MRKMGAKSLADLIKMAEIIDVHGNGFRHRPSSRTRGRIRRLCVGLSFRENRHGASFPSHTRYYA